MEVVRNFIREVNKFSRLNWWVYIIYFMLLGAILLIEKDKLSPVFFITSLHFVADIFIMMMFTAYARGENRQGTYYQVMSMLLFMSLKIYTGLIDHSWHYLAADPVYIFAAIKNYSIDIKKSDLKFINYKTMAILSVVIFSILIYTKFLLHANLLKTPAQWIQTIGIFLFAIALSVTGKERLRSELAIIALIAMVGGSAWETTNSLISGKIVGLALSYFLLPLTVLVFYAKDWPGTKHQKRTYFKLKQKIVEIQS
jgi:hypothetical protein